MSQIKIAGATVNQTPLDWKNNLAHIVDAIAEAKTNGVQILCFPELAITSYNCEDLFLTYWLPKKASDQLKVIIPHTDGITVAVGLPVRLNTLLYNCVCMIKDGEILGFTAKQFLARDGVHYEPRWFDPWPANEVTSLEFDGKMYPFGDITYDLHGIKIGFEICEDAWRGDARPGYRLCDRKVDLIMNPSASHFAMAKSKIREDLVTESTLKFNCTYLFCNLLGNEAGRMIYDGETIIAKSGKIIAKNPLLSFEDFNLTIATVDFQDDSNNQYNPYLHHYDKNVEFADATSLALFDYMRKVKSQGFVLSLSGGADSAACAVLVAQMVRRGIAQLGPERFLNKLGFKDVFDLSSAYLEKDILAHILHTAYQSSNNSSKDTLESAQYLATSLGASFYQWEIASEVDSYTSKIEKAIGRTLNWEKDDIAMQNIQARSRSPIIWLLANLKNALLLTTSNRSEGDVGYTTMDGDTSGSIAPIAGVDKYFILQWLKWAEKALTYYGLSKVNALQPSAELRPSEQSQTDEQDLMPYSVIVEIERHAIRDGRDPVSIYHIMQEEGKIADEILKGYIIKFFKLWSRNQWKRERLAPSFHLDEFNVDPKTWYRFPIVSASFEEELDALNHL